MEYHEMPILAPEEPILKEYRKTGDWARYEQRYSRLIQQRHAENHVASKLFEEGVVLLCSEDEPAQCHRRLAAEYLAQTIPTNTKAEIVHL